MHVSSEGLLRVGLQNLGIPATDFRSLPKMPLAMISIICPTKM